MPTLEALVKIALLIAGLMTAAAYLVLVERWIAAWVQDRLGPNRVGIPLTKIRLFGLGQPLADGVKFLFKEEFTPAHVDKLLYFLAPIIIFVAAIAVFAVIPFGSVLPDRRPGSWSAPEPIELVVAPGVDVGMIYVFAVGSIAVYGVVLGGWASNNKYSFLGGLRSGAQLISYELPLGLGILGVVLASGSLRLDTIIAQQAADAACGTCSSQPLGFLVFCVAAFAEAAPAAVRPARGRAGTGRRLPHRILRHQVDDVPGGRVPAHDHRRVPDRDPVPRRLAFLGPDRHRATRSTWPVAMLRIVVLLAKVLGVILFFMLARWSWPRFRFDQLMDLGLEGDAPVGAGEPGGGGRVDRIRRPRWPRGRGVCRRLADGRRRLGGAAGRAWLVVTAGGAHGRATTGRAASRWPIRARPRRTARHETATTTTSAGSKSPSWAWRASRTCCCSSRG